jgi:hypothetical protein
MRLTKAKMDRWERALLNVGKQLEVTLDEVRACRTSAKGGRYGELHGLVLDLADSYTKVKGRPMIAIARLRQGEEVRANMRRK